MDRLASRYQSHNGGYGKRLLIRISRASRLRASSTTSHMTAQACQVNFERTQKFPWPSFQWKALAADQAACASARKTRRVFATDEMTFGVEGVVDGSVGRQKSLGGWRGFEPLHLSLSSSNWQVRILRAVVLSQSAWLVPLMRAKLCQRPSWNIGFGSGCGTNEPAPEALVCRLTMSGRTVQYITHFCRQFRKTEGLCDQFHTFVEPAVVNDGIARVAGREQHLDGGENRLGLCCQLSSGYPRWKHDIGEQ